MTLELAEGLALVALAVISIIALVWWIDVGSARRHWRQAEREARGLYDWERFTPTTPPPYRKPTPLPPYRNRKPPR
jgi:hypothetical protein